MCKGEYRLRRYSVDVFLEGLETFILLRKTEKIAGVSAPPLCKVELLCNSVEVLLACHRRGTHCLRQIAKFAQASSPPLCKGRGTALAVEGLLEHWRCHYSCGGIVTERKHNTKIVPLARNLRKNMTREERHLWYDFLRGYPAKFLRQKPIGKYIVDFYCAKAKIVVELDGSQHFEQIHIEKDTERTAFLEQYGIKVIRIPNNGVNKNFSGVCEYIDMFVKQSLHR